MPQTAILVELSEWENLNNTVNELVNWKRQHEQVQANDTPMLTAQVAMALNVDAETVRRARREGRLRGFLVNEKEYGFLPSEVERYRNRYNRT